MKNPFDRIKNKLESIQDISSGDTSGKDKFMRYAKKLGDYFTHTTTKPLWNKHINTYFHRPNMF